MWRLEIFITACINMICIIRIEVGMLSEQHYCFGTLRKMSHKEFFLNFLFAFPVRRRKETQNTPEEVSNL